MHPGMISSLRSGSQIKTAGIFIPMAITGGVLDILLGGPLSRTIQLLTGMAEPLQLPTPTAQELYRNTLIGAGVGMGLGALYDYWGRSVEPRKESDYLNYIYPGLLGAGLGYSFGYL